VRQGLKIRNSVGRNSTAKWKDTGITKLVVSLNPGTRHNRELIKLLNNLNNFNGLVAHTKAEWHEHTRIPFSTAINPLHATPRPTSVLAARVMFGK